MPFRCNQKWNWLAWKVFKITDDAVQRVKYGAWENWMNAAMRYIWIHDPTIYRGASKTFHGQSKHNFHQCVWKQKWFDCLCVTCEARKNHSQSRIAKVHCSVFHCVNWRHFGTILGCSFWSFYELVVEPFLALFINIFCKANEEICQ